MRRQLREIVLSVGAVLLLLLLLTAMDDRVREQVSLRVVAHPGGIGERRRQARDLTTVIAEAARYQTIGHAPLLIFTLSAAVLMLFMLRT
jgi:hypothetical protein